MVSRVPPLVSVLTPSLDQEPYLRDCLESVSRQTYDAIEHVVMDGGSRDGSVDLLERSSRRGLRWRSEPDRGQAHALNKAFETAEGSIIGWVNSDDAYADRRAVAWAVDAFERNPAVDLVFGHALLVNEENAVLHLMWAPRFNQELYRLVRFIVQPTVFVRRSAIEREGTFLDERYDFVFDRDLFLRLGRWSTFHHLGEVVAIDRHQRARKVETAAYLEEALRYDEAHGLSADSIARTATKALKITFRVVGAARVAQLQSRLDPAFELRFPPRASLVRAQLLRTRGRMPFGDG
jgi:glycosyltransferase involved in cell wall biosynthesis